MSSEHKGDFQHHILENVCEDICVNLPLKKNLELHHLFLFQYRVNRTLFKLPMNAMLQHLIIQFPFHYLSSGFLRKVKKRKIL